MTSSVEGGRVPVIFGREGYSFGNISVRITPLTYDQFEARGYDLDNFFPARPPAASSKKLYTITISHSKSVEDQVLLILYKVCTKCSWCMWGH